MRNFVKINIFLLVITISLFAFCSICWPANMRQSGFKVQLIEGGKVSGAITTLKSASGGPSVKSITVDFPQSTILMATASLTVKKGICKIELLENGKSSLTLRAKGGQNIKGIGRMSMNSDGTVQYRITANKAQNIFFKLSVVPLEEKITSPVALSPDEKFSSLQNDLKLSFSCLPEKNCRIRVQNNNSSMAYRNILFEVEYKMPSTEELKSNRGSIENVLLPNKTEEWPTDLIFKNPPQDIKITLLTAAAGDPSNMMWMKTAEKKKTAQAQSPLEGQIIGKPVAAMPSPPKTLPPCNHFKSLRFFESGFDLTPYDERVYESEFEAASTRYVNWELNLHHPAPGKRIEYDVEAVWYRSNGSIFHRQKMQTFMEADWSDPYCTYSAGDKVAGKVWLPDIYRVEIYIGTEKITESTFKVY